MGVSLCCWLCCGAYVFDYAYIGWGVRSGLEGGGDLECIVLLSLGTVKPLPEDLHSARGGGKQESRERKSV